MNPLSATRTVTVSNPQGLHLRPADMIVRRAKMFSSTIELTKDKQVVDAKSMFGIMTLAAEQGTQLEIRARGDDAFAAVDALSELFERGFASLDGNSILNDGVAT
jgi:phosphotransferase system HPr (HPr) family protein